MTRAPDYLEPYRRALASVGPGFGSLLFGSREMQTRRFEVLAGALDLGGRRIADLGSGHGDLLAWLVEREVELAGYVGVEAVAAFDHIARERVRERGVHEGIRARFIRGDFVADPDLLLGLVDDEGVDTMLFSGSLNTLAEAEALAVLDRAWLALARAPRGLLGFNFLAGGGSWTRPPTNLPRRDTGRWLSWALARTPELMFCQHYLGAHDATLIMVRPDQSS